MIQATQPNAWDTLAKSHGASAEATICDRIRQQLDARGTFEMLRHGVEMLGLRQPLSLAQAANNTKEQFSNSPT